MWQSVAEPAFAAWLLSISAIALLLWTGLARRILDKPNARSLHENPTPRTGGICFMTAGLTVAATLGGVREWMILALALPVMMVSLLDDIKDLPVLPRIAVQAGCALAAVYFVWPGSWALGALVFIVLVWSANAYNFMDGADGLAAGMAVFGFGSYAVAAAMAGLAPLAAVAASIAGAALGFLFFNFVPARIFMGDAGAIPLGFLAALIGLAGWREGGWAWWFGVLVFSPFLMDSSVMILRRLARGERVFVAHREHYYQRAIRAGLGHRGLALTAYVLMAGASLCALGLLRFPRLLWPAAGFWLLVYGTLFLLLDRLAPMPPPYADDAPRR